jgi:signal peptidase I
MQAAAREPGERRVLAPLLAIIAGPLGHVALGYWRRACYWFGTVVALEAGAVAAAAGSQIRLFLGLFAAVIVVRLAMVIDVARLERGPQRPTARALFLLCAGMALFYGLLAGRVRSDVVEFFAIPTGSMSPTLIVGDHMSVRKNTTGIRRGEVVTHQFPTDHNVIYVKRVIALGGDTVSGRDGQLFVNDHPLERRKLDEPCPATIEDFGCALWEESLDGRQWRVASSSTEPDFGPVVVPADAYFVVGDNRGASSDSRVWGPVGHELITGRAQFIWLSHDANGTRWDRIGRPVQ